MSNEISELQNIDFSLGAHLVAAFQGHNPNYGPREYREFITRTPDKQIYRSERDEPGAFLQAVRSTKINEVTLSGGQFSNLPELPVVYYFRKPGFDPGEEREAYRRMKLWTDETTQRGFDVLFFPLVMNYTLKILAWDKPTLDKLNLLMYAHLYENYLFDTKYAIHGYEINPVQAEIRDHRALMFDDESMPVDEGRLWVTTADFMVHSQVVMGDEVSIPESVLMQFVTCGFCLAPDHESGEQFFEGCE